MTGCVNTCKYCPQATFLHSYIQTGNMPYNDLMLSLKNYITMLDKLPKSCISIAGFSEPFKNKSCMDMIDYAGKQGHIVIIYTSLIGMTIADYDRLRKMYHVRGLTIHLPDKEGNTITKITDEYKEVLQYVVQRPMGGWCSQDYSLHGSAVHPDIAGIINIPNPRFVIHDRAGTLKTDDPSVHKIHWESGKILCGNGFGQYPESGIVMPNGDAYLCCMDFNLKHKLGNLLDQSWDNLMLSDVRKRAKKSRETGVEGICRRCCEAQMDFRV